MRLLHRFALISTLGTYLLIFVGGLVRVAGAGMGCPDWPKCFGRWIPPTSLEQLPQGIDPSTFNVTLAWIEYINRLFGMTLGLFILATAIIAISKAKKTPLLIWLSIAAALLVAYQGWQGSVVVASDLRPIIVSAHLFVALLIAGVLQFIAQKSYYLGHAEVESRSKYPVKIKYYLYAFTLLGIVQIVLGTQLRGAIELLHLDAELGVVSDWVNRVGPISHLHQTLGVIVAAGGAHVGVSLLMKAKSPSSLVYQGAIGLLAVSILEVGLGLTMFFTGTSPVFQLFHLVFASLYMGLNFAMILAVHQSSKEQTDVPAT